MVNRIRTIKGLVVGFVGICLLLPTMTFADAVTVLKKVNFIPLQNNQVRVNFQFDKKLAEQPRVFITKNPARLILDLPKVGSQLSREEEQQTINIGALKQFRAVEADGRTRIVLSLQEVVAYRINSNGQTMELLLTAGHVSTFNGSQHRFPIASSSAKHSVQNVNFSAAPGQVGKLVLTLSDGAVTTDVRKGQGAYAIDFINTRLPKKLEYRLNVKAFGTPVQSVATTSNGAMTHVALNIKGGYEAFSYQVDKNFVIEIRPVVQQQETVRKIGEKNYTGKRMSLNFQDIKVRQILQLVADVAKINIVVSDSVQGNMTIRLNQVPWDQALDIILRTRGLAYRQYGSVMMVAPAPEVASQEKSELQAQKEIDELTPLTSELLQVNYAKASEVAALLKDKGTSLLSPRGNVSVDERTNTLWIQDASNKIAEVRQLVHQLDKPVRQVLIEARIVLVSKNFERDLGVRFGVTDPNHISGTITGANEVANGKIPGVIDRLNVNLAAAPTAGKAASVGIALAKLAHGTLLDLELSAIESEGKGEVVSTPRVITANKQPALIESGREVPYQETTSSGATSVAFKKAVLSLGVTPQITPDNRVLLDLKVNQDTVDEANKTQGVPQILTKEIETHVLVDNGQTLVLGGIFQRTSSNGVNRVPFLGRMPILGALFRNKVDSDKQEELLIFVTPKIIQQNDADEERVS